MYPHRTPINQLRTRRQALGREPRPIREADRAARDKTVAPARRSPALSTMPRIPRSTRLRLSYANVVATLALFAALGGSSYAAFSITGKQVRDGSLSGRDVRNRSITGKDVRDRSLLARDFRPGQLPAGPQGPKGDPGAPGTPDGYTKAEADGRFLPSNGKAADAETLDGVGSNGFVQGRGDVALRESLLASGQVNASWFSVAGDAHLRISCPKGVGTVELVNDSSGDVHAFASSVVDTSARVSEFDLGARLKSVPVLAATGGDSQVTLQVLTGGVAPSSTHLTTLVISVLHDVNGGCRFVAHSLHSDSSEPLG